METFEIVKAINEYLDTDVNYTLFKVPGKENSFTSYVDIEVSNVKPEKEGLCFIIKSREQFYEIIEALELNNENSPDKGEAVLNKNKVDFNDTSYLFLRHVSRR